MDRIRQFRLKPTLLLAAALLLRAAIPAGYMPAGAGSGLLFEFCPEGIPTEFMQVLAGDSAHQHGHMDHGEASQDDHHCPIGHMLTSAAAVDNAWQAETMAAAPPLTAVTPTYSYRSVSRANYYSRGPPA